MAKDTDPLVDKYLSPQLTAVLQSSLHEIASQLKIANKLKAYSLKLNPRLESSHCRAIDSILKSEDTSKQEVSGKEAK